MTDCPEFCCLIVSPADVLLPGFQAGMRRLQDTALPVSCALMRVRAESQIAICKQQ